MGVEDEKPQDIRERAFQFAVRVVSLCHYLDRKPGVGRTLSKQVLRAGTSVGANLEEAQAGQSRADFISKNLIALKEARETIYWLRILGAAKVVPEARLLALRDEAGEIARIVGAIVVSAKKGGSASIAAVLLFPFSLFLFSSLTVSGIPL